MPCSSELNRDPVEEMRQELDRVTELLCSLCKLVEGGWSRSLLDRHYRWFKNHLEHDEREKLSERRQELYAQLCESKFEEMRTMKSFTPDEAQLFVDLRERYGGIREIWVEVHARIKE